MMVPSKVYTFQVFLNTTGHSILSFFALVLYEWFRSSQGCTELGLRGFHWGNYMATTETQIFFCQLFICPFPYQGLFGGGLTCIDSLKGLKHKKTP